MSVNNRYNERRELRGRTVDKVRKWEQDNYEKIREKCKQLKRIVKKEKAVCEEYY